MVEWNEHAKTHTASRTLHKEIQDNCHLSPGLLQRPKEVHFCHGSGVNPVFDHSQDRVFVMKSMVGQLFLFAWANNNESSEVLLQVRMGSEELLYIVLPRRDAGTDVDPWSAVLRSMETHRHYSGAKDRWIHWTRLFTRYHLTVGVVLDATNFRSISSTIISVILTGSPAVHSYNRGIREIWLWHQLSLSKDIADLYMINNVGCLQIGHSHNCIHWCIREEAKLPELRILFEKDVWACGILSSWWSWTDSLHLCNSASMSFGRGESQSSAIPKTILHVVFGVAFPLLLVV